MTVREIGLYALIVMLTATAAAAQDPDPGTRQAVDADAQAEKAKILQPYVPSTMERVMGRAEDILAYHTVTWHPYSQSAAQGGGMPFGVGYMAHLSAYNFLDLRASYSINAYKRGEAEFVAPRLFNRRGELSVLGGWREATQVSFYGIGPDTSQDRHAFYAFQEGYGSALLTVRPTRRYFLLRGGVELARWTPEPAREGVTSAETVHVLPGVDTTSTYLHTQGTIGFDWRPAPNYARRGGFYGITAHDYHDRNDRFSFHQVDYEVVQHVPILREAWVISLRGLAETTYPKEGQDMPFYLLPHLGGGSTLRGFDSWRFRDRSRLLLQAEWRIMVNRFVDTAVFYDAGTVAARAADLDLKGLKDDYGFGVRFHTPFQTALRVEIARSNELTRLVFSTTSVF